MFDTSFKDQYLEAARESEGESPALSFYKELIQEQQRYQALQDVLQRAYNQAAKGKGAERHGTDLPFEDQPMQSISKLLGTEDGLLYQAMKKIQESTRMDRDASIKELLGAINYLAGAVIFIENNWEQ